MGGKRRLGYLWTTGALARPLAPMQCVVFVERGGQERGGEGRAAPTPPLGPRPLALGPLIKVVSKDRPRRAARCAENRQAGNLSMPNDLHILNVGPSRRAEQKVEKGWLAKFQEFSIRIIE